MNFYRKFGKRALDLAIVLLTAPLWLPLMGVVALLVRFKLGSPVLFRHSRPGLNEKIFVMLKFRSMNNARDAQGYLRPDAERLTPFGQRLRDWSLDELPELFNVLRGDLSLVGPRPLHVRYLRRYTPEQARRHEVMPGITGWAQINGRNTIKWDEKFRLDLWYVNHQSLGLDLKILFLTLWKVIRRDDISHEGDASMPEFWGAAAPGSQSIHDEDDGAVPKAGEPGG